MMEEKLKTLEDLKSIQAAINDFGSTWTNTNQLKQEAIKWYKKIFQYGEDSKEFKKLFNITEEEIK